MSITAENLLEIQKKLGIRIRELRKQQGLSQLDLATRCDLEKTSISRVENGRTNLTLKTLLLITDGLQIELADIFNEL